MDKQPAIQLKNITKTFGSVLANDKVWLNIYKGEILALLGENGSGKTTLMNMISGIYFPDEIWDYKYIIKKAEKYISKTIYKTFSKDEVEQALKVDFSDLKMKDVFST